MTARRSAQADVPRGAGGWLPNGQFSPKGDPLSQASQAMTGLIARRREYVARRLTPKQIVAEIARDGVLERMFSPFTLARWMRCDEWRAWEVLDCYPPEELVDAFPTVATSAVVKCGYLVGEFWGGRYVPFEWDRAWRRRGLHPPRSAWLDEELLGRYGPPTSDFERDLALQGLAELGIHEPENDSHAAPADGELPFDEPITQGGSDAAEDPIESRRA